MSKKYVKVGPDDPISVMCQKVIDEWHPDTKAAGVTIDILLVTSTTGHALAPGGWPAAACIRIVSLKDRTKGVADVEIQIDGDTWGDRSEAEQEGLLDHELYHLIPTKEDEGEGYKLDEAKRPKITMRPHTIQVGWFQEIAERRGEASPEIVQAKKLMKQYRDVFWPFMDNQGTLALAE